MIDGRFHDGFPLVSLQLLPILSNERELAVEFIVDTGFEGQMTMPKHIASRLGTQPLFTSIRSLADGTLREYDVVEVEIEWNGEIRNVEVLIVDNRPLLGTELLAGCRLSMDISEGGDVSIEFPD